MEWIFSFFCPQELPFFLNWSPPPEPKPTEIMQQKVTASEMCRQRPWNSRNVFKVTRHLWSFRKDSVTWRFGFTYVLLESFVVEQWWRICLPIQKTWIRSLGQEDPLEEEMATPSSILAREIPWTEEPGGLYCSWGRIDLGIT